MRNVMALCLVLLSANASAATAFLVSCQPGTSVTGQFIYTGTYQYAGQYFTRSFRNYCPSSVEVY